MNWQRAKTDLGRTLIALGIVVGALNPVCLLLTLRAFNHGTTKIDPASGHIFPFNNHGVIHYVTGFSQFVIDANPWVVIAAFALVFPGIAILRGKQIVDQIRWNAIARRF